MKPSHHRGQPQRTGLPRHPRTATGTAAATAALAAALALTAAATPASASARPAASPRPSAATAHSLPGCGPHTAVHRALRTLTGADGLAGAAVEVTDPVCGRWSDATGTADLATGRPMNARDALRAGSVTKTFTATALLQLAAEHRVDLDAPVARHLPGLIKGHGYDGRKITLRQLLQHTSGLPDYLDAPEWEHPERLRYRRFTPRELIARALTLPAPGKRPASGFHYATTNYVVAGLVIRQVTGRSAESEVTRRIVRPLHLRDTYWPGDDTRLRGPHSHSYYTPDADSARTDGTDWNMTSGGVGGALVSSPADLERFFGALLDGRLLPPEQLAQMRRTVPADPDRLWPGARYGLGLISSPLPCGGVWWGHAGTVPGGHRALGAVGPGGRRVAVALNEVPPTEAAEADFRAVVATALCEGRPPRPAPATPSHPAAPSAHVSGARAPRADASRDRSAPAPDARDPHLALESA